MSSDEFFTPDGEWNPLIKPLTTPKKKGKKRKQESPVKWDLLPGGKQGVKKLSLEQIEAMIESADTREEKQVLLHAARMVKNRLSAAKGRKRRKDELCFLREEVTGMLECLADRVNVLELQIDQLRHCNH